jgi:hypothetical protein
MREKDDAAQGCLLDSAADLKRTRVDRYYTVIHELKLKDIVWTKPT